MIVVGSASAAAGSVAIPAHQPGDLILVFTKAGTTISAIPAAGGTVPTWTSLQAATANALGLRSAYAFATATTTTTGTWTNATHIIVLVLRPDSGKALGIGASSTGNANNQTSITYPALTLQAADGTSFGVRAGVRVSAASGQAVAPTNWTNQRQEPTGSTGLLFVHTRAALAANPTADQVTGLSSQAYRAHTIEVREVDAPSATPTVTDGFNRADVKPPGAPWFGNYAPNGWQVVSNTLRNPGGTWDEIYWGGIAAVEQEMVLTMATVPATGTVLEMHARRSGFGTHMYLVELGRGTPDWLSVYKRVASVNTIIQNAAVTWANGDTVAVTAKGTLIRVFRRSAGGSWVLLTQVVNAEVTAAGDVGISSPSNVVVLDDFAYSYIEVVGSALTLDLADTVTTSDAAALSLDLVLGLADSVASSDSLVSAHDATLDLASMAALFDSIETAFVVPLDLADTVGASDALDVSLDFTLVSTAGVGDFLEVLALDHGLVLADSVTTSDALARAQDFAPAFADTATPSDAMTRVLDLGLPAADTVSPNDSLDLKSFDPLAIPGCKWWHDASLLAPGAVPPNPWANLVPAGQAAGVGGAPAATTTQAGINGRSVLRLSSGNYLAWGGTGIVWDFTLFYVGRMVPGGVKARVFAGNQAVRNILIGYWGNTEGTIHSQAWSSPQYTGAASDNIKLWSADGTSALWRLFDNGGLATQLAGPQHDFNGEFGFSWYEPSDFELAEFVMYDRKLTDVERQQVEAYLRLKWLTPGAALTLPLADTVTPVESAEIGFQFAPAFTDSVAVSDELGIEVTLTFSDGVNVSDDPPIIGAAVYLDVNETVTVSDLLGIAVGEYIEPCHPNPIVGTFKAGDAVVGTYWVCAKKGILGLGARAPALEIRNLAASPAGLALGTETAYFVGQKPTIPGGGMYLGGIAPGLSLHLTPPLAALALRTRVPLNVGLEPPIYPAGLELGGHVPKFAGKEPPVEPAALALGGIVPGFRFSHTLAVPASGLGLGAGTPAAVEVILILPAYCHPADLLPVPDNGQVLTSAAIVTVDLVPSTMVEVDLVDVESTPADLDELECV